LTVDDPRADLRFLLPLFPGQRALLPAREEALASAISAVGLQVADSSGLPWPVEAHSAEHVLLPALQGSLRDHIAEAARALRPGGYLLLGVTNRRSLYRWSRQGRSGYAAAGRPEMSRLLIEHAFLLDGCYGVRDGLDQPALRVPLTSPGPSDFYFRRRFTPVTRGGALLARLASVLAPLGAHSWLYPGLLFVARYQPPTGLLP
jgi:SAM-dependent methyltransferase